MVNGGGSLGNEGGLIGWSSVVLKKGIMRRCECTRRRLDVQWAQEHLETNIERLSLMRTTPTDCFATLRLSPMESAGACVTQPSTHSQRCAMNARVLRDIRARKLVRDRSHPHGFLFSYRCYHSPGARDRSPAKIPAFRRSKPNFARCNAVSGPAPAQQV